MDLTNVHQAKTHLSKLLDRVANGEEIVIGKAGRPVAKLVPFKAESGPRKIGLWKGKIHYADDFEEWPKDMAIAFGMEEE